MLGRFVGMGLAFLLGTIAVGAADAGPPVAVDRRLVLDRIAAEPEVVTPTGMAIDAQGRLLVIESHTHFRPPDYPGPKADRILLFQDRDGDGRPERLGVFFEGTRWTMNVAVARDGTVLVATRSSLHRLEDRDGDGRADGCEGGRVPEPIIRLDSTGDYPHNGLSGFAFDRSGLVYFGLGENLGVDYRLIGRDGTTLSGGGEGGNIYRCRPDGTKLERIATGFWNPFHMAFGRFGQLFAVDNDPDSRPPCRLLHIVEGGDYGYRFRNGRRGLHPFTAWNGELPGTLGMVAGTGEAPSGVVVYEGADLPDDYRGTVLVTSWGDHRIERYDLQPRGATFQATMKPVVVGGDDFRPVGIAVAPDGTIYATDWVDRSYTLHGKGRIWRLRRDPATAAPSAPAPAPRADDRPPAGSPLARAEALRQANDPSARGTLLEGLDSDDPFIREAARYGLGRTFRPADLVAMLAAPGLSASRRLGLMLVLRDRETPEGRALLPRLLADPDPRIRFAAIQWVGESRLEGYRSTLLDSLASPAATRETFQATLAALEMLDNRRRDSRDEQAGEDYIAAILKNPKTPAPVVRRALRMIRPDHPALTEALLDRLLRSPDEATRIEAVRSLARGRLGDRFDRLARLAEDRSAAIALRAEAIAGLADDAGHRLGLLVSIACEGPPALRREAIRDLRGAGVSPADRDRMRRANHGDPAALALVDRLDPKAGKPAGATVDAWLARLEGPADPSDGERLFFHPNGPGCYRCHQVEGRGGRVGPDLSTIGASADRRRLIESIVAPSREVAPQYVAWNVARVDGTVFTGILLEQAPDGSLVFGDPEGRRIAVKADEIADRRPQATSIMPEALAGQMTIQELRDLLAFLSRRSAASLDPVQ